MDKNFEERQNKKRNWSMVEYMNQFEMDVQTDFTNPGSQKSGEYLRDQIDKRVSIYIFQGRENEVIDVMRKWIIQREHLAMIAVSVAKKHSFSVLVPEIAQLNLDVLAGKVFHKLYSAEWIAPAIQSLSQND